MYDIEEDKKATLKPNLLTATSTNSDPLLHMMAHDGGTGSPDHHPTMHFVRVVDMNDPPFSFSIWNDGVTMRDPPGHYLLIDIGYDKMQLVAVKCYTDPTIYPELFEGFKLATVEMIPYESPPGSGQLIHSTNYMSLTYEYDGH